MLLFIFVTCTLILLMVLSLQNTTYEYMATPNTSSCTLKKKNGSLFEEEVGIFKSKIELILKQTKEYSEKKAKAVGCDDKYKSDDGGEACEDFQNPPPPPTPPPPPPPTPCEIYFVQNQNLNRFFNSNVRGKINEFVENINNSIETSRTEKKGQDKNIKMARDSRKT
jgi:hypothetical protein